MRADDFAPLSDEARAVWGNFLGWDTVYFPTRIGMELEEVRMDYARIRLPFDAANTQPAGVIHGGAIASLIDTVVVPAIGTGYPRDAMWTTIDLHVQYQRALTGDAVCEGWVTKRGRSVAFTHAEVTDDQGRVIAVGSATYSVRQPA